MTYAAEPRPGVLSSLGGPTRDGRPWNPHTLESPQPTPIDDGVAHAIPALRLALRDDGRSMPRATRPAPPGRTAHGLAATSRDGDSDGILGLMVIRL